METFYSIAQFPDIVKEDIDMAKNKDPRRYVIIITERGEMYREMLEDGLVATAKKCLGALHTGTVSCGMDNRFSVIFPVSQGLRKNEIASRLAQEYLAGPVMIVSGTPDRGKVFSRYAANDTIKHLRAIGGDEYV